MVEEKIIELGQLITGSAVKLTSHLGMNYCKGIIRASKRTVSCRALDGVRLVLELPFQVSIK